MAEHWRIFRRTEMHTPGPWEYGVRKDGSIWLSLGDYKTGAHYQGDLVASPDDAKLIAAAPDLLEALREMVEDYKSTADSGDCGFYSAEEQAIYIKAMAAIAKAT
jgi:hypothetical protein